MASSWSSEKRNSGKDSDTTGQDESSDSETEPEPAKVFHKRFSTNREIKTSICTKAGYLMKQTNFQRWKRRYFKLKGRKLYYAKNSKASIFDEIELTDLSVAECSTKNINHSFQVITPFRNLALCAESRREMEEWITALKTAASKEYYEGNATQREMMSGQHNWYACSHARPTYCNVCREALSGVTSHGLSCEVCKFKAHKRCAVKAHSNCKWTTLASIGDEIIEDEDGITMPHQWLEGNLPVSAKCAVCDKICGSVRKLQDWRCLWCKAMVHMTCRDQLPKRCPLSQCRVSILPPTAINNIDSDGYWEATRPPGTSPLLVFVNTKSGDNQGVKFLRRFKQLLNPAQVFDLMNGGPHPGCSPIFLPTLISDSQQEHSTRRLRLFQKFDQFRILVCGGDGSIGWVLSEIDRLDLHRQCQIGVLPFGTGNDLARVLGWGSSIDDDTQLPIILEKLEHSQIKMLDRWSIWVYEGYMPPPRKLSQQFDPISVYEDSVANHLSKILHSEDHSTVISSAKVLCETVKDFVAKVGKAHAKEGGKDSEISQKCNVLNEKLESLLNTLNEESQASTQMTADSDMHAASQERDIVPGEITTHNAIKSAIFKPRGALMSRANSLKKAIRQIIEHTERAVDEQNAQTQQQQQDGYLHDAPRRTSGLDNTTTYHTSNLQAGSPNSRSAPSFSVFASETPLKPQQIQWVLGISSTIAGRLVGGSFISKVLLANADALCAAASPLVEEDIPICEYTEKCVMNNYFGIGLDAKITLDFQNKREEHPEKCRSRTKNLMWYGVLGGKEILQRTFKNLDQRVQLECDGQRIPLPSLQGIVILNISSYGGGANFWGGKKEDDNFTAPSFDDKILEVVAVFGSMQMAVSRVIDLQHHRIAQCRSVKITIMGDEGVPVQADGEAWIQPPGYIRVEHKNRSQMLTRDRTFEMVLKTWSEKQKSERSISPQPSSLSDEETHTLQGFVDVAIGLIKVVKVASLSYSVVEQELFPLATRSSEYLDRLYPSGRLSEHDADLYKPYQPTLRSQVVDFVHSVRQLYTETNIFLSEKASSVRLSHKLEEEMSAALSKLDLEIRRITDILGMQPQLTASRAASQEELNALDVKRTKPGKLKQVYSKLKGKGKDKDKLYIPIAYNVNTWTIEDVGQWLDNLSLGEYKESFMKNEIRGTELLTLDKGDIQDLGVTKVGHLKRIQQGIKELQNRMASVDKYS